MLSPTARNVLNAMQNRLSVALTGSAQNTLTSRIRLGAKELKWKTTQFVAVATESVNAGTVVTSIQKRCKDTTIDLAKSATAMILGAKMWQKARIIKSENFLALIGKELWVEAARPEADGKVHQNPFGVPVRATEPYFTSNLDGPDGQMMVRADTVELLPQFTDSVETVKWEDFSR